MSPPVGDRSPFFFSYTSKVAEIEPDVAPVSSTEWLPSSEEAGTFQVKVTSPFSSATPLPIEYGVEC